MSQPAESRKPKEPPVPSLKDLAASQGVKPAKDLDALAAQWPADDDPDALDAFISEQRAARRSAARG